MYKWIWRVLWRDLAGNHLDVGLHSGTSFIPRLSKSLCLDIREGTGTDSHKGMGFTAIWISPVVEQVADGSRGYTGYAAQDLYAVNSNFGTAADLKALATALHNKGMVCAP